MSEPEFNDELFTGGQIEPESTKTETSKCPSCGADLVYDVASGSLKCPYCGEQKELRHDNYSSELDIEKLFTDKSKEWNAETKTFRCKNCGAVTVVSRKEIAKNCAYCGTSNIVEEEEMSGLKPNAVLPFTVTKEKAKESLLGWAKKRFFAPNNFKKSISPEKIRGNYIPCFTFDAQVKSKYYGRLGEYYYVTRTVNGKQVQERRIRYFNISGTHNGSYDDVLVKASDKIPQKAAVKLGSFDTNNSQQYSPDYLYGFTATQYTKDGKACWEDAKGIMLDAERKAILSSYKYDVVDSFHIDAQYSDVTYKYVLLPIYIGHYLYKKKIFNFFVNGRTGKVAGQAPKSIVKIGLAVLAGLIVVAGLIVLYLYQGGYIG